MPAFVERELTARRGRKRAKVQIRVHAPRPDANGDPSWECAFEVTVNGERVSAPPKMFGIDGMQALLLAIGWVVYVLEQYENDTGMQIEEWGWLGMWSLRIPGAIPGTRRRAEALRRIHREYREKYGDTRRVKRSASGTSAAPRARAPRVKPAPRKAPRRRRAAPRPS